MAEVGTVVWLCSQNEVILIIALLSYRNRNMGKGVCVTEVDGELQVGARLD